MTSTIIPRPASTRSCTRRGRRGPTAVPIAVPASTVPTLMNVPTTRPGRMAGDAARRRPARLPRQHGRPARGGRGAGGGDAAGGRLGGRGRGGARARVAHAGGDRARVGAVGAAGGRRGDRRAPPGRRPV